MPSQASGGSGSGNAAFKIVVPAADASNPQPASLVVTLLSTNGKTVSNAKPVIMNLGPQSAGCTAVAGGALSCVANVAAPGGNDTFSVATYSGPNQTGSRIAASQTSATVKPGATTKCTQPGGVNV